jgi:hypothetical protein
MNPTFAQVVADLEARAWEAREDPIERVRYSGYVVMLHDLLMYPRERMSDLNIARLRRAEGLI